MKILNQLVYTLPILGLGIILAKHAFAQDTRTGLTLPRFVSLRSHEVNIRTGPGLQYPIKWIYQRKSLPIEITAEYETWRKVKDWEGTSGWVHQSMLTSKRTLITLNSIQTLKKSNTIKSRVIAQIDPSVIGVIKSCNSKSEWCNVEIGDYSGWLRRSQFWGIYVGETVR